MPLTPLDLSHATRAHRLTFMALLESIYGQRYCGSITVHFQHGAPTVVEVPTREALRVELESPPRPRRT